MARVELDESALRRYLEGPEGPVARSLAEICIEVESEAKLNATGRPGPNVQTGRLRSSITWQLVRGPQGWYGEVGSAVEYAHYVEYGTEPHRIYPTVEHFARNAAAGKRTAALYWKGARHPVAYVNHPGNPAYPYLRPAVIAVSERRR